MAGLCPTRPLEGYEEGAQRLCVGPLCLAFQPELGNDDRGAKSYKVSAGYRLKRDGLYLSKADFAAAKPVTLSSGAAE